MIVSELMADITPSAEFAGIATNDDFVLAVKTSTEAADPKAYTVVQQGIISHEAGLNPQTKDSQYLRTGLVSTKTGNQRIFTISGDRYIGDKFQDFCLSHTIKFGIGSKVIVDYVYFDMLTGKGEQGKAALIVNDDQTGEAGANASFAAELRAIGTPTEYTYAAPVTP